MAVGTDTGIYFRSIERSGIYKALSCENVTQLAVLEKYHILLVLSGIITPITNAIYNTKRVIYR